MAIERHTTEETADDLSRRYGAAYLPLLTVTAISAASTMIISGTSIGVVVPDAMGAFGVGQDNAQLMATAYYIAMTVSQLLSVWLGGLLGQRRAFSIALLLFAMASVVGTSADDFSLIVVAKVVQGVGAGLIQTQTMLALLKAFPAERRGMAMGFYAAGMVLAIGIGPALGASLGTAVWAVFLDIRTYFHSDVFASTQCAANAASQEMLAGVRRVLEQFEFAGADHQSGALHYLGQVVHAQATARGFQDGFLVLSTGFLLAIIPTLLLGRRRPGA